MDDGRLLFGQVEKVSNGEVLVDHNGKQIVQIGESTGKEPESFHLSAVK